MSAVSGGGLSGEDFELHYHWLVFENQCLKRDGASFQGFFEEIMGLHDDTFIAVKPSGVEGDWECDGFSSGSGTVYQVYAPDKKDSRIGPQQGGRMLSCLDLGTMASEDLCGEGGHSPGRLSEAS